MQHRLQLFITVHLALLTHSCYAMEKKTHEEQKISALRASYQEQKIKFIKSHILNELPTQYKNAQADFLTNNSVIIGDSNGCRFIDLTNNKETVLYDEPFHHLIVHPNKKSFALPYRDTIRIYDTETRIKKGTALCPYAIKIAVFNPANDTIFLSNQLDSVTRYNYLTKQILQIQLPTTYNTKIAERKLYSIFSNIALLPTQRKLLLTHSNGYISMHEIDSSSEVTIITAPLLRDYSSASRLITCSPNESLIANCSTDYLDIVDSHSRKTLLTYRLNIEHFRAIAFHPNNSVIAGLIAQDNFIMYMDAKRDHRIAIMSPLFNSRETNYSFSFCPDGTKLIIALLSKCVIVEVPFEVIYQSDTKERLPHLLFLLKNYQVHQNDIVPQEITQILMHTLLATFKR